MNRFVSDVKGVVSTLALCVLSAASVRAATGSWAGSSDAVWTNNLNWSASPYPGAAAGETAKFDGGGNGNTTLDLTGLASISKITFNTALTAAYSSAQAAQTRKR